MQSGKELAAQRGIERAHLLGLEQLETALLGGRSRGGSLGHGEFGGSADQGQRPGGPESDAGDPAADLFPQLPRHQRQLELRFRAPGYPDQAEVAYCGAASLGFALQLHDLVTAADRGQGVRGAEDAAADDDQSHEPIVHIGLDRWVWDERTLG